LAEHLYDGDFTDEERERVSSELSTLKVIVATNPEWKLLTHMTEGLVSRDMHLNLPVMYKLLIRIAVIPVGSAGAERAFSAMKIIKNRLRSKMNNEYLNNHMLIYNNKVIADNYKALEIVEKWYNSNTGRRGGKLVFSSLENKKRGIARGDRKKTV